MFTKLLFILENEYKQFRKLKSMDEYVKNFPSRIQNVALYNSLEYILVLLTFPERSKRKQHCWHGHVV